MNEDVTKQVFEWVKASTEKVVDWGSKEIPPFVNEFLQWKFLENVMGAIGGLAIALILMAAAIILYKLCVSLNKKVEDREKYTFNQRESLTGATIASGIGCAVVSILFIIYLFNSCLFPCAMECMKIKVAPKVYLIEHAAKILSK